MEAFVTENKKTLKKRDRAALTHLDFRPENILAYDGELYLIDFDSACVSDPYSDFVFCISMQPKAHIPYSKALIKEYFHNSVPDEFWWHTCFYCIMAVQRYAIWKYRRQRAMVKLQAEHLYELYDKLRSTIPDFWGE